MVLVSSASGPRVPGCTRAPRGELKEIPGPLVSLQAAVLKEREKKREKERVAAAEAVEAAGGAEAVAKAAQEPHYIR